jgi:chromosome segregation ATPase
MIEFEAIKPVLEIRQKQAALKAEAGKINKALSSIKQRETDARQGFYSADGELSLRRAEYLARYYMGEMDISVLRELETRRATLFREREEIPIAQKWLEARLQEFDAEQEKCKTELNQVEKNIKRYENQKERLTVSLKWWGSGITPPVDGGQLEDPQTERRKLRSYADDLGLIDDCDAFLNTIGG